jgi:hypothetical protein
VEDIAEQATTIAISSATLDSFEGMRSVEVLRLRRAKVLILNDAGTRGHQVTVDISRSDSASTATSHTASFTRPN